MLNMSRPKRLRVNDADVHKVECKFKENLEQILYTETWLTTSGQALECELFNTTDDADVCGIMHEPTCSVVIPGLPHAWSRASHEPERGEPTNSAKLECGHVFHPVALALHFITSDMRCPVCRKGFSESMDLMCIRAADRSCYEKKLKSIRLNTQEFEQTERHSSPCVEGLLNALELQLSVRESCYVGRELTNVRTRILYTPDHVQQIEIHQETQASEENCVHPNFLLHRSFQRLIAALVSKNRQNPERGVQFKLEHPLVPVSISSKLQSVQSMYDNMFDSKQQHSMQPVPLYCEQVTGSEPVAHLRVFFVEGVQVPQISIDVNIFFLLNIASYVNDVLESIRTAVEQHITIYDSPATLDITQNSVNGLELQAYLP